MLRRESRTQTAVQANVTCPSAIGQSSNPVLALSSRPNSEAVVTALVAKPCESVNLRVVLSATR